MPAFQPMCLIDRHPRVLSNQAGRPSARDTGGATKTGEERTFEGMCWSLQCV